MSEKTKNKIFWSVFALLILYAIVATYLRVYVYKNYLVSNEVSCDVEKESCFVYTPVQLCEGSEDSECVNTTEAEYYKIIYKKAANIPFCEYNPELGESCPELTCSESEPEDECYYEYCTENCGG